MKISKTVVAVLASIVFAPAAFAAPGKVTFQGEVASQTCQATISGETKGIVLLPTVVATDLKDSGTTAGLTPFEIQVTDCNASAGELQIKTKFQPIGEVVNGNLPNLLTGTDAAKGVSIQITTDETGSTPVTLDGVTEVQGLTLKKDETSASHKFGVQYHADSAAEPGKVQAEANYTLSYD